jgi:holo-[acyl-carrier protein] synthase
MIIGIGTDIVEVERFVKHTENGEDHFSKRFFTVGELNEIKGKKHPQESMAGKYAAKEAVAKAFGTGLTYFKFQDIEILRDEGGKPYVNLHGKGMELAQRLGIKRINLSISHTKNNAIAFCIMEGEN